MKTFIAGMLGLSMLGCGGLEPTPERAALAVTTDAGCAAPPAEVQVPAVTFALGCSYDLRTRFCPPWTTPKHTVALSPFTAPTTVAVDASGAAEIFPLSRAAATCAAMTPPRHLPTDAQLAYLLENSLVVAPANYEWTQDWFSTSYYGVSPPQDPQGPATGTDHNVRGGAFGAYGRGARGVDAIGLGEVEGPEDMVLDADDNLYCGGPEFDRMREGLRLAGLADG